MASNAVSRAPGNRNHSSAVCDVLVIGAGIQGAGIAQACAANGWRTLVLEQYGSAAEGTSSKSSKLIHGGLRYLESLQIGLVRECLQERSLLLRNAPHLVQLREFVIPVSAQLSRPRWQLCAGLWLYRLLGGLGDDTRFRWVSESHSRSQFPQLNPGRNAGAFIYQDAQTDDRKLTEAVLRSACDHGASIRYNSEVAGVKAEGERLQVMIEGGDSVTTRLVVNAAGPWINQLAGRFESGVSQLPVELVRGSHILLNRQPEPWCYYLESPRDRRPLFVLPWGQQTLVGTTEVPHTGAPDQVVASEAEIDYLLEAFQHYFTPTGETPPAVAASFAGLRVLPAAGKVNARRRDTQLVEERCGSGGYIGVYGGKLTAYRQTAERVARAVSRQLGPPPTPTDTRRLTLP